MSITEYIQELERVKRNALSRFSDLTSIKKQLIDTTFSWIVDNLETKKGSVIVTDDLSKKMNNLVNHVINIVNKSSDYEDRLTNYLSDLSQIGSNIATFHSANNLDVKKAGLNNIHKAVVGEIIDQYTQNGLNANFAQPLRDLIYRNVLGGMRLSEAKTYLNDYILSGQDESGRLDKYLTQTAQQGVDSYTGAINSKLASTFNFTGYIISGSIIDTTSKQCRYAIEQADAKGYLSNEAWQRILQMAADNPKAHLIDGTTLKNLPINKLHWGCRHEFTPFIGEQAAKQNQKKEVAREIEPKTATPAKPISPGARKFEKANTRKEAEEWIKKNAGIEYANYSGLDLEIVNDINKAIFDIKQVMPNIGTKGVGSAQNAAHDLEVKIINAYKETDFYKELVNNYGEAHGALKALRFARNISRRGEMDKNVIAWSQTMTRAILPGGDVLDIREFTGVFLNASIREAKDKVKMDALVKKNSENKWFTDSAKDFGYIIHHELGHEIDKAINFNKTASFKEIYDREHAQGTSSVVKRLSVYGATAGGRADHKPLEMIAEAWAEFMTSKNPRPLAKEIGELLLKEYYDYYLQGTGRTFLQWRGEITSKIPK